MARFEPDRSSRRTGVVHGRGTRDRRRNDVAGTAARDWLAVAMLIALAIVTGAWFISISPSGPSRASNAPSSIAGGRGIAATGSATPSPLASGSGASGAAAASGASASPARGDSKPPAPSATDTGPLVPTDQPTGKPTDEPSIVLPATPTDVPSVEPSLAAPGVVATDQPTDGATDQPVPTDASTPPNELTPPSEVPSSTPTDAPPTEPPGTEPPTIAPASFTIDSIADGETVQQASIDISGAAPPGATVTRNVPLWFDDHVLAKPTGRWTMRVQLAEGDNALRFRLGSDQSTEIVLHVVYVPSP